ncbi:hypothetical protein VST7929_01701 [Vibrio stylophorae]|uniref:Uncharacterized protein n=1 Tax=Vibrio stylophorae TaxID=659351 RepID=A0ABM8ZV26_9VIBR|nr:hypothetical protein [Vibrio stylophorae]CAH0533826.1 hypothetical protein VST7929_01701 [Vibrio stylophorae]
MFKQTPLLLPAILISFSSFAETPLPDSRSDFQNNDYNCYIDPMNHIARERGGIAYHNKINLLDLRTLFNDQYIYITDGTQVEVNGVWAYKWWGFNENKQWCGHNDKLHYVDNRYTRIIDQTDTGALLSADELKYYGDYITPSIESPKWRIEKLANTLTLTNANQDEIIPADLTLKANQGHCQLTLKQGAYRPVPFGQTIRYQIPKNCNLLTLDVTLKDATFYNTFTFQ